MSDCLVLKCLRGLYCYKLCNNKTATFSSSSVKRVYDTFLWASFIRHGGVGASVGVRSLASIPSLPPAVAEFVKGAVEECKPSRVHVVTGTPEEAANILAGLEKDGMVKKLPKYENW